MSDDANNAGAPAQDAAPEPSEHLNLKVKSQDGNEVYFKVRRSSQADQPQPFARLLAAFVLPLSLFFSLVPASLCLFVRV